MAHRFSTRLALRTAVLTIGLAASALAMAVDKVVFQVTDADTGKWNMVLNNVRNMQKLIDADTAEIEIVAYGPAVALLKSDSSLAPQITELVGKRVKVVVCRNTMAGMKLTPADMLTDVGYVPAGVVEVLRKQQEGYAYIRP